METLEPMRVVTCGDLGISDGALESAIARCAERHGIDVEPVVSSSSAVDVIAVISELAASMVIDLLVCDNDLLGLKGISAIKELREHDEYAHVILAADTPEHASEAMSLGVDEYVLKPFSEDDLDRVLDRCIAQIVAERALSIELKFRDYPRRVDFSDIIYAETFNHDQLVHLADGSKHAIRLSSKALFDQLARDPRFFKAGSSFIVNLDWVRAVGSDGVISLADQSSVTVPIRVRKQFESALMAHHNQR